ncbi:MAG: hypothetical protein IJQ99_02260 [Synergistaceae bacterium]|nr:hypothetical protein [Synergistaceae bacterium]
MSDTLKTVLVDSGLPVSTGTEGTQFVYNLLPIGRFYDKRYGEVIVSNKMLQRMAKNFGKYPSYEVPVKIGHDDGALSPGKVIATEAKPEGLVITMVVDKEASDAILKGQYRYMSAEFDENYQDKATGRFVGAVLLGAALVNQPANPYMEPLKLVDDINPKKGNENMDMELEELKRKLSEAEAQTKFMREELEKKTKMLSDVESQVKENEEKTKKLLSEAEESAKKLAEAEENAKKLVESEENAKKMAAEAEEKIKNVTEEAEATAKKLADIEAENKVLLEERERIETEKNEAEVKAFCDKWTAQGIPPAAMEKVKPLLLGKPTRTIKLSDKENDEVTSLKFFDDIFEAMPKMQMKQMGSTDQKPIELSDVEKAKARAKAIADSLK